MASIAVHHRATVVRMNRFEAELKLAGIGYQDLPDAAGYVANAERMVAGCTGMSNRRVFHIVDSAWADLRDGELRQTLRDLHNALLSIADSVNVRRLDERRPREDR